MANIPELIRHIQQLAKNKNMTIEEAQEFEFYKTLYETMSEIFDPNVVGNLIQFPLKDCPIDKAQSFIKPFGLHLAEGGSGIVYLSWSKGFDKD